MKNPKSRRKVLEAQKIIEPDAKIPELDEPDPLEAATKPLADQIAALQKKIEDDAAARDRDGRIAQLQALKNEGIKKLRAEHRYLDEGIQAVEKIMEEKGILDPMDAAAIYERDHPPQNPVSQSGGTGGWNFAELPSSTDDIDDKYVDSLLKAGKNGISEGALSQRINQTISEVRGNARR
jgi:hypothetical protein